MPSSPYDLSSSTRSHSSPLVGDGGEPAENHPLIGGSVNSVDDKQVLGLSCLEVIWFEISLYYCVSKLDLKTCYSLITRLPTKQPYITLVCVLVSSMTLQY